MSKSLVLIGGGKGLARLAGFFAYIYFVYQLRKKEGPLEMPFDTLTTIQHPYDGGGSVEAGADSVYSLGGHSGRLIRKCQFWEGLGDFGKAARALAKPWLDPVILNALSFRYHKEQHARDVSTSFPWDGDVVHNHVMAAALLNSTNRKSRGLLDAIAALSTVYELPPNFRVLPSTLDEATLVAHLDDGSVLHGEAHIGNHHEIGSRIITSIELEPPEGGTPPQLFEGAAQAIRSASKIIVCPGSMRTSIEPNLKVGGMNHALKETSATIHMVVNAMTKWSETHQWTSDRFVDRVVGLIGRPIDVAFYSDPEYLRGKPDNNAMVLVLRKYSKDRSYAVDLKQTSSARQIKIGHYADWDKEIEEISHNLIVVKEILGI